MGVRSMGRALGVLPSRIAVVAAWLPIGGVGAEIGVHLGDFSADLLRALRPETLHLIDPWRYEPGEAYAKAQFGARATGGQQELDARHDRVAARFSPEVETGRVVIHRQDSADALSAFPDGHLDWAYIDGNHLYEFVRADLDLCLRKVRSGGVIAGDDYRRGRWWKGGVKRAVDELAASGRTEILGIRGAQFAFRAP